MRPSGNTHPPNTRQSALNPLLCGFDGLYLSYYGQVPKDAYNRLSECGYVIPISDMNFKVQHTARGPYRMVLDNAFLSLALDNRASSPSSPAIYAQVRSEFIWSAGFQESRQQALRVVTDIYGYPPEREQVSRVDLFADILWSKQFHSADIGKFSTRARSKGVFYDGERVSGFTIGKGDITVRIYDKTLEIHKSGKEWLYDLWGVSQDNQDVRVWRVEFQLRREALKEFGIESFNDLVNSQQALWNYCVQQWLSVRVTGKKNVARRALVSFWEAAQAVRLIPEDDTAKIVRRERMRSGMTEKQAADQMAGITKSYARNYEIENPSHALDCLIPRIRERLI